MIRSDKRMSLNDGKTTSEGKTSMHQTKKSSKKGKTSCQKRSKSTKTKNGKKVSVQGGKDWENCEEKADKKSAAKPSKADKKSAAKTEDAKPKRMLNTHH